MSKKSFPLSRVYQLLEPGPVVLLSTSHHGKDDIMAMSWHTMLDFEPPLIACVVSNRNFSFSLLKKSKECVINIPTVDIIHEVIGIGNCTGKMIDKFAKFHLSPEKSARISVPRIAECFAQIECKVIDTKMATKYNLFILEAVKAWISSSKTRPKTIHHSGYGTFIVDGKILNLSSKKK